MLPIYVQDSGSTDLLSMLLPVMLCCVLLSLFQRGGGQPETPRAEFDSWYVNTGIQEAYDAIVKEIDNWRENAITRKKSRFSFFSRKKPMVFVVTSSVPPRLIRISDEKMGQITFELTDTDGYDTAVKATYDSTARTLIQDFKVTMPIKTALPTQAPSQPSPKLCPSCGKEMLSEYKVCPFCETKLK